MRQRVDASSCCQKSGQRGRELSEMIASCRGVGDKVSRYTFYYALSGRIEIKMRPHAAVHGKHISVTSRRAVKGSPRPGAWLNSIQLTPWAMLLQLPLSGPCECDWEVQDQSNDQIEFNTRLGRVSIFATCMMQTYTSAAWGAQHATTIIVRSTQQQQPQLTCTCSDDGVV